MLKFLTWLREREKVIGKDVSYCIDANYAKGTNNIDKGRRQLIFEESDGNKTNK